MSTCLFDIHVTGSCFWLVSQPFGMIGDEKKNDVSVPFFIVSCVFLGEKEESMLPVSRSCSAEIPPPLNLASATITAFPEIITEAPSPTKSSELTGSQQTEAGSGGRRTSDLTTLLEVSSPPSFPGHRHSKSMDGKTSFK